MPIRIRQLEWLNHNAQRSYPLSADATGKDVSETFELPDDFIVSMYLPVHWGLDVVPGKFFLKSISTYPSGVSVVVGYSGESGDMNVASAVIARDSHTRNQVYTLGGIGNFVDSRGHVVIGSFDQLDLQPSGLFQFDLAGGRLEPDCIRPNIRGVMSLQAINGPEVSEKVYGNIRLQAGRNFRISTIITESADPVIVFDAIEGEGFTDACVCQEEAPAIKSISGVRPDNQGDLQIIGNDCLKVSTNGNVITIEDVCSEPCCGCRELEAITQALEAFGEKATTIENFLINLEARVTQMDMVVLGSRLGDRGCEPS